MDPKQGMTGYEKVDRVALRVALVFCMVAAAYGLVYGIAWLVS